MADKKLFLEEQYVFHLSRYSPDIGVLYVSGKDTVAHAGRSPAVGGGKISSEA